MESVIALENNCIVGKICLENLNKMISIVCKQKSYYEIQQTIF